MKTFSGLRVSIERKKRKDVLHDVHSTESLVKKYKNERDVDRRIWDTSKGIKRSYFDAEPLARLLLHEKKKKHVEKELQRTNFANYMADLNVEY